MIENPRESQDNLGIMVCFHKRYTLGDKHGLKSGDFDGWVGVKRHLYRKCKAELCYPLYLYDHSMLHIKIGNWYGLLPQGHAEFDSGQVGYIYTTRQAIRQWYGVQRVSKEILDKAKKQLESEVVEYNEYLAS